ncbi:ATP-binding cassette domain-containing protein [Megamonas rupellensis]|mgnify:FL=1|nr:ATP-binding cassette domain-containing protein [Megamonas rupellensis]
MPKNTHFDNSAKMPKWLFTTDEYTPPKDKDNFWQKTLFSITTKLIFLRQHNYSHKNSRLNPSEKLLFIFLTIILINSAQKIFFPLIILAFSLIYLSTLNTKLIISILKPTLISTLFSLIIILPSLLLNNTRLFYLPFKIFITVLLLAYIAQTIPFYRLIDILPTPKGRGNMSKDRPPYHLSGGEQKKVALAAILALNPDVLMIDEPLNGLDNKTRQWFKEFLINFIKANKTILISTHEQELLSPPHSRIIKFNDKHTILN